MRENSTYHIPVLLVEALEALNINPDGIYIDATLGGAGHSREIAKRLSSKGKLYSFDQDGDAIKNAKKLASHESIKCEWKLIKANFAALEDNIPVSEHGKIDGILYDLGVSSYQLDTAERGFSYSKDGELDMRMDEDTQIKAKDLLNVLNQRELEMIFREYGEEYRAKRIVKEIIKARKLKQFSKTNDLTGVIQKVVPVKARRKTAMRVFQALRIAVNNEVDSLRTTLPQAFDLLAKAGRLAVISFHSLEDREVKIFFRDLEKKEKGKRINKNVIVPSLREVKANKRSRSARMRIFEKSL